MGIEKIYKTIGGDNLNGWSAVIEDWGSLHYVYIFSPNMRKSTHFPTMSLRSAKIWVTKELGKGIVWETKIFDSENEVWVVSK